MTTLNDTYLKTLFKILQPGCVVTADWLESHGISRNLLKYYLKSGWLESVGRSAYKKPGDKVEWQGALNSIQNQTQIKVHVGGLSALSLQGYSHYYRLSNESLHLFTPLQTKLPKWFISYNWGMELQHHLSSFLPPEKGLKEQNVNQVSINISSPERAIMECLFLAPQKMDLVECYYLFEGLVNLKPKLINELLAKCKSVKVKRLFLYMAEKSGHQWFQFLKTNQIDIGKGNRMFAKNGVHVSKYLISIPKELVDL